MKIQPTSLNYLLNIYYNLNFRQVFSKKPINHYKIDNNNPLYQEILNNKIKTKKQTLANPKKSIGNNINDFNNISFPTSVTYPKQAIDSAIKEIENIESIEELKTIVDNFSLCDLKKISKNTLFLSHEKTSPFLIIGELPTESDHETNRIFSDDNGVLLTNMLKSIQQKQTNFSIAYSIFWRTPGGRRPTKDEINICRPFIEKAIAIIDPKLVITLGTIPLTTFFQNQSLSPITHHGQILEYKNSYTVKTIKIIGTFSPSYLQKQPQHKKLAWEDLQKIQTLINEINMK